MRITDKPRISLKKFRISDSSNYVPVAKIHPSTCKHQ